MNSAQRRNHSTTGWLFGSRSIPATVAKIALPSLLCFSLFWTGSSSQPQAETAIHWAPERTWVYIVGVLEWRDSRTWAPFPKKNRRDRRLVQRFAELGVPRQQITFLKDEQATTSNLRSSFPQFLKNAKANDTLIVYYAGHGYRDDKKGKFYMVPYDGYEIDTLWSLDTVTMEIEKGFAGNKVILAADCCYSGCLRDFAANNRSRHPYAAFSSGSSEDESTANWTFSDCLVEMFDGSPVVDSNQDGVITLEEGGKFVSKEMAYAETQTGGLTASPNFGSDQGWIRTTRPLRQGEGELVIVRWQGADYKGRVQERKGQKVLIHWLADPTDSPDEWVEASTVRSLK